MTKKVVTDFFFHKTQNTKDHKKVIGGLFHPSKNIMNHSFIVSYQIKSCILTNPKLFLTTTTQLIEAKNI